MPDLKTATVPEILAELRARRDELDAALLQVGRLNDIVLVAVCRSFQVTYADLKSNSRPNRIAVPRQVAMTLLQEHGLNWAESAAEFSKDHGTSMHAAKSTRQREAVDPAFASKMQDLRIQIAATVQVAQNSQISVQKARTPA